MSRRNGPGLFVTLRDDLALVRGEHADRVTHLVSPVPPAWSASGGGWVIPASLLPDLLAYAQDAHLLAVVQRPVNDPVVA